MTDSSASSLTPEMRSGARGTLITFFANNPVAANLLMVVMLLGGFLAARGLTTQVFPDIDPGIITVAVPYPGATPSEVEESITRRVDEAVRGIDGIDRVVSKASEGYGRITVELKDFVDSGEIKDDIQSAVDALADFPPLDAEEPEVVVAETLQDVMTLAVRSGGDEFHLDNAARDLEQELLKLPQVSLVSIEGQRGYEITIEVSEEKLRQYQTSIEEIANAIARSSLNLSSGEIRTDGGDLLLRTDQKRESGEGFENVVLRSLPSGTVLRLGDIATINDGFVDDELTNEINGERAVFVRIQASKDQNVLDVSNDLYEFFETYEPAPGITVSVWEDASSILSSRLSLLLRNGTLGFALVFLFLVLMLDLRLAFWVAMGVPISFLGGFLFFDFFGVNINMVSLFALIVVLGIVVDDAIVIGENIGSEQQKGLLGSAAAVAGVRGVFSPVFVGVVTTMVAFAPLLFVTGTMGQILGVVPVVVIAVLAMSLVEVFFILPAHLSHEERWSRWPLDKLQSFVATKLQWFRDNIVSMAVKYAVRHRYLTVVYGLGMLALAFLFVSNGAVRVEFFPQVESDSITVEVNFPVGTPFEVTRKAALDIQDVVIAVNQEFNGTAIASYSVTAGGRTVDTSGPADDGPQSMRIARNLATIGIQLHEEPLRTVSANELERIIRVRVGDIPNAESVNYSSNLISESSVLEYELVHDDDARLKQAVEWMRERFKEQPMLTELRDTLSDGKRQFDIELTPEGEAAGLSQAMVARQLRQNFFGEEVQRIQRGRDEIKVMVRYPSDQRRSTSDLFNTRIRTNDGIELPLSTVANVSETRSFSAIDRVDGYRVITISAEVDKEFMSTGAAAQLIQREIIPDALSRFPELRISQAGFGREQARDLASLQYLATIAIVVIFALLAAQMRSYSMPFVILAGIPFGAAGAVIGHFVLGYDLSMVSMFGMVALSGVVVNDSLVLVDRYRRLKNERPELSVQEAIVEAARLRFRAIFLTTATTALGLTPMLFETSLQAQFLIPMAVSLATGIVFASVVIVFLVPSLVVIRSDILRLLRVRESRDPITTET